MRSLKSVPITKDEAMLLVQLVGANKIVTSKATNATNNQLKDKAWLKITEEFNSSISCCPRETKQLKLKWENMKKTARKRSSNIRMNQFKTGGGKPDYIPPDDTLDQVASILGATCEGYSVPFGGDEERKVLIEPVTCLSSSSSGGGSGDGNGGDTEAAVANGIVIDGVVGDGSSELILTQSMVTTPNRKFLFGASSKRSAKSRKVTEELAASNVLRNIAVAEYYTRKKELLDTFFEEQKLKILKLEFENEKLRIDLENLKK